MGAYEIFDRWLNYRADRQKEERMTEDYEYVADHAEPVEEAPEVVTPVSVSPATKPAWTLGDKGVLRYGSEGKEVDYINRVLGVDAASFTKATEEAVKNFQSQNRFKQTGEVVYVVYYQM